MPTVATTGRSQADRRGVAIAEIGVCGAVSPYNELLGGKLQVRSFSTFMGSCGFLLPPLSSTDYQKYASFTLSIVHTIDLNEAKQKVQLMLGTDDPVTRLVFQTTGIQPRQRNLFEVTKSALPNGGSGSYQPLFKLTSGVAAGGTAAGWQIESISINGSL